jgi:hypothetical protein
MYDRVPNSSNGAPSRAPYAATDDPEEEKIKAEAAEIAEQVAESEAEEVAEVTARRRLRPLEALMLAMLAVSLVIHVLTLTRLFSVRNTLRDVTCCFPCRASVRRRHSRGLKHKSKTVTHTAIICSPGYLC